MGAGGLFVELLQRAPGIKLLVTSREQHYLREESTYEVKRLAVPASPAEEIEQFDAFVLFLERARRTHSGVRLTEGDRASVVRHCQLLDGAPLAVTMVKRSACFMRHLASSVKPEIVPGLQSPGGYWSDCDADEHS